ncbi:MAG: hypothetical protein K1X81_07880 [Bacteroidia bacterium]|nr:hypothetical protein [Bacteroidia bacterium]
MKRFFCFVCIATMATFCMAQEKKTAPKDTLGPVEEGLSLHLPLFNTMQLNYRLDAEYKFNKGRQSFYITAGPYSGFTQRYMRRKEYGYLQDLPKEVGDDRIKGFACGIGARFYLPDAENNNYHGDGVYPFFGVEYLYRNVHVFYQEYDWITYVNNGLTYYDIALKPFHERIMRRSVSLVAGAQERSGRWCYEGYVGVMVNYTSSGYRLQQHRDYNMNVWDYGRKWECIAFNAKVGYLLVRK